MSDAILTHGREELGIERYNRASSAGIDLCGRMLQRIAERSGRPHFDLSVGTPFCTVAGQDTVLREIENWRKYADALLDDAVEKGDYYTAVCYKTVMINLRTAKIYFVNTDLLRWPLTEISTNN